MSNTVPTIKIKTPAGPTLINLTDFDPKKHKIAEGEEHPAPKEEGNEGVVYKVSKTGKRGAAAKYVILDAEGKVVGDTEYETAEDAEAQIKVLIDGEAA